VASVNGDIDLDSTEVEHNVVTYNGNITLSHKTVVHGDIIVKDNKGKSNSLRSLKIWIKDSVVEGDIIVREEEKIVEVYLLNGGKVEGRIEGAEVFRE